MVGTLLLRGMLAGLIAGLLSFGVLKLAGEPSVDRAIAFESAMEAAHDHGAGPGHMDEPEVVSRHTQAGIGLAVGVAIYGASFGGMFALAFAFANGRIGPADPRALSALIAAAAFVAVYLVPSLKYPANPPSVGQSDTIGARTALFFGMMAISVLAMTGAAILRRTLAARLDGWNATLAAVAGYVVIIVAACLILPGIDEVPANFSATLLWKFRLASIGGQAVLWTTVGLIFGALTARAERSRSDLRLRPAGR